MRSLLRSWGDVPVRLACGVLLVGGLLALAAGCGSQEAPAADDSHGVILVSPDPDAPAVSGNAARLSFRIRWPEASAEAAPRAIFSDCQTIDIEVTGLEVSPPVTATITRPDDSASLVVPAGTNRAISMEQKRAGGAHLATTQRLIAELVAGATYNITYVLLDDHEPNDGSGTASALATDATFLRAVLDEGDDEQDWYEFAVSGAPATVRFALTGAASTDPATHALKVQLLGTDGSTVLAEKTTAYVAAPPDIVFTHEFVTDGAYYVRVLPADATGYSWWEYQLGARALDHLADSPWPAFQHDMQHTGISPYLGPQSNGPVEDIDLHSELYGSPSLGPGGVIYETSYNPAVIYAIGPDGVKDWEYSTGISTHGCPLIKADGSAYIAADKLYAVNADGSPRWALEIDGQVQFSAVAATDGTIYFGTGASKLYAVGADGSPGWTFPTSAGIYSSPAVAADGTIYVGDWSGVLWAVNPDGSEKWRVTLGAYLHSAPSVAPDGTVYIGARASHAVYAVSSGGAVQHQFTTGNEVYASPSIGTDGTIYCGSMDGILYAFDSDLGMKWSFTADGSVYASASTGSDGTIYIADFGGHVHALSPDGSLKWELELGSTIYGSPAVGADGRLYVPTLDGHLYAIGL